MGRKSLILPVFSNARTLDSILSFTDKEILLKNIRYSLIVSALALGLAGFSNASLARLHTVGAKKQTAKSVSVRKKSSLRAKAVQPKRPSFGEKAGLHAQSDELSLKSSVAL